MRGIAVTGDGPNPSGLCMCGCGEPTPIADRGHRRSGNVAGRPIRFIAGHHARTQAFGPDYEVDPDTGCWNWLKYKTRQGYGKKTTGLGVFLAHRWVYEQRIGPIPEGLTLDHLCRNRACVNPTHMQPVTIGENCRRGLQATKTHCKHGHEFTPENTYVKGNGTRQCRACNRAGKRRRYMTGQEAA